MRILLLGKNGQIGAQIERISNIYGHEIHAFSKQELDITNFDRLKKKIDRVRPEIVINTAAYHVVLNCERYPQKAFNINTLAVRNIGDLCSQKKIKFVHFSTSWVFDGDKEGPYVEKDIPNPLQIYGLSKFAGEIASINYNSDTIIIRTCGVFGGQRGSRAKKGNFILYILNEAKNKKTLEISSEQIVSVAYAEDLASGVLELLEKKASSGIYHLVNTGYCSWVKIAQEIVKLRRLNLEIVPVDRKGVFKGIRIPVVSSLKNTSAKSLGVVLPPWRTALIRYLATLP
ncbi:MAG: dTDP-4-dehydrorhamnose reductase [Candidatus Levybacteria bacterium]|nr:dTDP-4-dehydrorhamnose reductase [Candidatus Levybacteria bacterium]